MQLQLVSFLALVAKNLRLLQYIFELEVVLDDIFRASFVFKNLNVPPDDFVILLRLVKLHPQLLILLPIESQSLLIITSGI